MARVESLIKLNGTIGDLSFYKSKSVGYQARMKTGVSGARIANDPAFARTRENGSEFGRSQQEGKKLRELLRDVLFENSDNKFSQRLASRLLKVIQMDSVNIRGERVIVPENLVLLDGMECNQRSSLRAITLKPFTVTNDRFSGDGFFSCSQLIPNLHIAKLSGATHVQYTLVLQEFSGDELDQRPVIRRSAYIKLGEMQPMDVDLMASIEADPEKSVLVLVGTGYFQMVNNAYYPLANGQYNALTISQVIMP
ncbi:hypothetical protein SF1_21900 [Sphingobacterium faecium NBRC 15299]|uniref:hypothetical protein n=1 Tax=Sphingobacterium faecium TaxID=34087 RepID=UPI000D336A81|nr:hypothetical protein [Sphingobacterium faecium]PTX14129.1 hypothetical protein C8N37_101888 [Sphingobacterium faecium]GEM64208.1 hypothetical protein SF1_21900 [Sphingobacterium faecium NBRC 15299]